eukprot:SAG31_NODE_36327_length_314_cov_0.953488_1_plen_78_part_01
MLSGLQATGCQPAGFVAALTSMSAAELRAAAAAADKAQHDAEAAADQLLLSAAGCGSGHDAESHILPRSLARGITTGL